MPAQRNPCTVAASVSTHHDSFAHQRWRTSRSHDICMLTSHHMRTTQGMGMARAWPCCISRASRERRLQAEIDLMIFGKYIIWSPGPSL